MPNNDSHFESSIAGFRQFVAPVTQHLPPRVRYWIKVQLRRVSRAMRKISKTENQLVVYRNYSSLAVAEENIRAVIDLLDKSGIPYIGLPREGGHRPRLVVPEPYTKHVEKILKQLPAVEGWNYSRRRAKPLPKHDPQRDEPGYRENGGAREYRVGRHLIAPNGRRLDTRSEAVEILIWKVIGDDVERVDGDKHIPGTIHRHPRHRWTPFAYVDPKQWVEMYEQRRTVALTGRFDGRTTVTAVSEPIDVVYTWVDGSDPKWVKRKADALGENPVDGINATADNASRYISRNELRYSLRFIEMYANWVRNVYVVTDQQIPPWLNTENSRVHVIDHSQIFKHPEELPVFNSHAIESQLHHIPGLSDRYIYLNDDVFLGRPIQPSLFFTGGGLSKFFLSKAVLDASAPTSRDLPVLSAAKHNRDIIGEQFARLITQKFKHTPHAQIKSVLNELESIFPDEFQRVSSSKIRHPDDISVTSSLHHYWAYCSGKSVEGRIRYDYFDLVGEGARERLALLPMRRDLHAFCINDTTGDAVIAHENDLLIDSVLNEMFPLPSEFEKPVTLESE